MQQTLTREIAFLLFFYFPDLLVFIRNERAAFRQKYYFNKNKKKGKKIYRYIINYEMNRIYLYENFRNQLFLSTKMTKMHKPTDAELEILQVMWVHGPSSVRFVNDILNQKREVGYTTTLKIMQIMTEKGLLRRDTENRSHIYQTAVSEEATQQLLLDEFVENAFRGSAMKMVMQALGHHTTSDSELEAIKSLIRQIENDKPL